MFKNLFVQSTEVKCSDLKPAASHRLADVSPRSVVLKNWLKCSWRKSRRWRASTVLLSLKECYWASHTRSGFYLLLSVVAVCLPFSRSARYIYCHSRRAEIHLSGKNWMHISGLFQLKTHIFYLGGIKFLLTGMHMILFVSLSIHTLCLWDLKKFH